MGRLHGIQDIQTGHRGKLPRWEAACVVRKEARVEATGKIAKPIDPNVLQM